MAAAPPERVESHGPEGRVFDLDAIAAALHELNLWRAAQMERAPQEESFYADAEHRMLHGYRFVDAMIARGETPLAYSGAELLLEINHLVLCGVSTKRRAEYARHMAETERRFYQNHEAGADGFFAWAAEQRHVSPVRLAARVYRRVVSAPQLFIEGNQRSATLIASFVLGRAGLPPLVRTPTGFGELAEISAQCKAHDRRGWTGFAWGAFLDWRLEKFIERRGDPVFLRPRPQTAATRAAV